MKIAYHQLQAMHVLIDGLFEANPQVIAIIIGAVILSSVAYFIRRALRTNRSDDEAAAQR
jgi:hypothetical protein